MSRGGPGVGITTMAVDPPARFRELARSVEPLGRDRLGIVRKLAEKVLPRLGGR